jgi:hypothetical protein
MKKIAYIFLLAALFSCQTIPSADSPGLSLGKNPKLPEPSSSIIPTVSIAKASQWPEGVMPKVIDSFVISLYSKELILDGYMFYLTAMFLLHKVINNPLKKHKD